MSYIKVYKKDINNNVITVYNSVQELCELLNISDYYWRKHIKNKFYNGFYYYLAEEEVKSIKYKCDYCGKEFILSQARIKNCKSKKFYCSKDCANKTKKGKPNTYCAICNKPIHIKPSDKNKNHVCSSECLKELHKIYMTGENNHQYGLKGKLNASWKTDEKISIYGYKLIRMPDHPFKNSDGFVFEHRLVAEKYLLNDENSIIIDNHKYLSSNYAVHHLDFNKLNNNVNNLFVLPKSLHAKFHNSIRIPNRDEKGQFISFIKPIDIYTPIQLKKMFFQFLRENNAQVNTNNNPNIKVAYITWTINFNNKNIFKRI